MTLSSPHTFLPEPGQGRIAVAMSGGVDSSVAAALLVERGCDVVGVHMKLYDAPDNERHRKACCTLDDSLDAREVCHRLGIPYYVLDYQEAFRDTVMEYFVHSYGQGRTPNPCVMCNRHLKHARLLEDIRAFGCDYLATGHYARSLRNPDTGGHEIRKPRDTRKDQTYFLFGTPAGELPSLVFPLADYEKPNARGLAEELDLITWDKPDSQEICFVPRDYREFVAPRLPDTEPGEFVDQQGRVLGEHRGVPYYTIGQRRGLGLSHPEPLYVLALDAERNRVVLGPGAALERSAMAVDDVNWLVPPPRTDLRAQVKIRYADPGTPARLTPRPDGTVTVHFERNVRAITPGQAAVFYDGDLLLGGGWIEGPLGDGERPEEAPSAAGGSRS